MFRKGNRQIRNSSSPHTNGNIQDYDDGDLGVCCLFPSHLFQAIHAFTGKQRLGSDRDCESHCLDHSPLPHAAAVPLERATPCLLVEMAKENSVTCLLPWGWESGRELLHKNWSPNTKPFPLVMIPFGLSGGQAENTLQKARNFNELEHNLETLLFIVTLLL